MKKHLHFILTALLAFVGIGAWADSDLPRVIRPGVPTVGEKYYIASQFNNGGLQYYLSDVNGTVKQLSEMDGAGVWDVVASETEGYVYLVSQDGRYFDRAGLSTDPVLIRFDATNDNTAGLENTYSIWCQYPGTSNSRYAGYTADGADRASGWWSTAHVKSGVSSDKTWTTYVKFYNIKGEEVPMEELLAELAENITAAKAAIAYSGIGYPAATSEARIALAAAIEAAENYKTFTYSLVTNLQEATATFYTCTDIEKPVVGKYYNVAAISSADNSSLGYITYNDGGILIADDSEDDILKCIEDVDGKLVFKFAKSGKYLVYKNGKSATDAAAGENGNMGWADEYEAAYAAFDISLVSGQNVTKAVPFGLVSLTVAQRNATNNDLGCLIVKNATKAFDTSTAPFFNGTFTSAFKVEKVEYSEPVVVAELTLSYVLNETKTLATVSVEGLVEAEESTTLYYLNDNDEPDGMLENGNTFEVMPIHAPETIKVTVRQYDAEFTNVLAEGVIEIEFPEAVIITEALTLSYELNEGQTTATVSVEGLTGQGFAVYFLDEDEEPYGFEGLTFEVAPLSTPSTVKVTVREVNEDMSIIYSEGEIEIEFPELVDEVLFTTTNAFIAANADLDEMGMKNFGGKIASQIVAYADHLVILNFMGVDGCNLRCDYFYDDKEDETLIYNVSLDGAEAAVRTLDDGGMGVGSNVMVGEREFSFGFGKTEVAENSGYVLLNMTEVKAEGNVDGYYYAAWGELATAISTAKAQANGEAIYNINGQRVSKVQNGLYIVNGKKVVK